MRNGTKDTLAAYAILCRQVLRRWCSIPRSWTSSMQGRRSTPTTWKPTAPGQPLPVADARRPNFGSWSPTRSAGMVRESANGRPPSANLFDPAAGTSTLGWEAVGLVRPRRASDRRLRSCHRCERPGGRLRWRTSSQAVGDRQRTARGGRW